MAGTTRIQSFYLTHLSKPASDRPLYRAVGEQQPQSILELGIGNGQRATRLIQMASLSHPVATVRYVGLDLFESRSANNGPGMSLKMAHRVLGQTGARIRLIPGDPFSGLSREANGLGSLDLIIVSAGQAPESISRAWFYVPRLMHERTEVFLEEAGGRGALSVRRVEADEIRSLAGAFSLRRAA